MQRKCVVIAHAVDETGRRAIIGLDAGAAEAEAFWREFLRSLTARGWSACSWPEVVRKLVEL